MPFRLEMLDTTFFGDNKFQGFPADTIGDINPLALVYTFKLRCARHESLHSI